MSWPNWHAVGQPLPAMVTPLQSTVMPNAVNAAPPVMPPTGVGMAPSMQYSQDQWAQLQNWQQWAQWHQQYKQWHQQYGAEIQKYSNTLPATNTAVPPPPPNETKPPPPPPENSSTMGQYSVPPPNSGGYTTLPPSTSSSQFSSSDYINASGKRPLPPQQSESNKRQMIEMQKQWNKPQIAKQPKIMNLEELTEAEKKFDREFGAWEAQFYKWKEQNVNHPDKSQYLQYEKRWESWRNDLLDRREQMRKKRIALQSSMKPTFSQPPPTYHPPIRHDERSEEDNNFLKSSSPTPGGIPGLDLAANDPREEQNLSPPPEKSGPDYEAISKGLNSILGDKHLLNILSMVSQNKSIPTTTAPEPSTPTSSLPNLMAMNLPPPNFEHSNQSGNDYNNSYNSEAVNNFDDQTRMSFTNGPNEDYDQNYQQLNYKRPMSGSFEDSKFSRGSYEGFNNGKTGRSENRNNEPNFGDNNRYGGYSDQYDETGNNDEHWNDDMDFIETQAEQPVEEPQIDEPIFVPEVVVDYEHKPLKEPEPEISLDIIRMFDYRHKPVNRIPYPSRPQWMSNNLRNIPQFDPLGPTRIKLRHDPGFAREPSRYPSFAERPEQFRRPTNFTEREDVHAFSRDRQVGEYRDYEYGKKFDFSPKRRERNRNSDNFKQLDLEELSDDEWEEEKHAKLVKITSSVRNEHRSLADLINPPGRFSRPQKIVIILRGPPGSGKTYLAKLIKDREVDNGGSAPRILSLDDYFMVEHEKEIIEDGKRVRIKEMTYEYEEELEETYRQSLTKSFKKTITDGYFNFIVVDNINQKVKNFGEMWSFAKQNGFQVYICQLDLDPAICIQRNIHQRNESYIEDCIAGWEPTPGHHPQIDATSFLLGGTDAIVEVEMEESNPLDEVAEHTGEEQIRSKWDSFDCSLNNLARLDGVSKPLRPSRTMEEYLQLGDEWEERSEPSKPGQKRVRWADIEEQKQQKKMKALGFVVGQTDWNRIMDPTNGESALTQTKYIERVYK